MSRILAVLVLACLHCASTPAGPKQTSPGEAAAIIATDFCGAVVGEWPSDFRAVASGIRGLSLSAGYAPGAVPEPFKSQFAATLEKEPVSVFHTLAYDSGITDSRSVRGIVSRDGTLCQVTPSPCT